MRRYIITILVACLSATGVYSQTPVWDMVFERVMAYNPGGPPAPFINPTQNTVLDNNDNLYFSVNFRDTVIFNDSVIIGDDNNVIAGKVNDCGELMWQTKLSGKSVNIPDIVVDGQNNLYLLILNKDPESNLTDVNKNILPMVGLGLHLVKLTTDGAFIWHKYINAKLNDERDVKMVVDDKDDVYVFTEYEKTIKVDAIIHTAQNDLNSLACIKLASDGTVYFIKNLASHLQLSNQIIVPKANYYHETGNLYLLVDLQGPSQKLGNDTINGGNILIELNKLGDILDYIHLKIGYDGLKSFVRLDNGDYIVGGEYSDEDDTIFGNPTNGANNSGTSDIFIARIDKTGKSIWFKDYAGAKFDYFYDIVVSKSGTAFYATAGTWGDINLEGTYYPPNINSFFLAKYDLNGNNLWLEMGTGSSLRHFGYSMVINNKGDLYYSDIKKGGVDYRFGCYENKEISQGVGMVFLKLTETDTSFFCDIDKCYGGEVELTPKLNGQTYKWNTGAETKSITTDTAGVYYLTINTGICAIQDSIVITESPPISVSIISDSFFCGNDGADLAVAMQASGYLWSTDDTTNNIKVSVPGEYSVIVDSQGCIGYDTVNIISIAYPQPMLDDSLTICFEGNSIILDAGVALNYMWDNGEPTQTISVNSYGTYKVDLFNGPCSVSDEIEVMPFCESTIYVPSAFRPTSDYSENRLFGATGNRLEYVKLSVYNRWGELLFEGENDNAKWDGTFNGVDVIQGRYMYLITYKPIGGGEEMTSGYFTLLR